MDRLYNTWGHFETLTYSLGDAEMHLGFASEIREIKKDLLGLAFTYGCLGDLYGRSGNFKLAKEFYDKDIAMLKQLNIEHFVPGLTVKMADQLIKEGLLENEKSLIVKAVDLCKHGAGKLNNPFFANKGIIKGLIALLNFAKNEEEKNQLISKALEAFYKTIATTPYEKAFWHRLKGRLEGVQGNFSEA